MEFAAAELNEYLTGLLPARDELFVEMEHIAARESWRGTASCPRPPSWRRASSLCRTAYPSASRS